MNLEKIKMENNEFRKKLKWKKMNLEKMKLEKN